MNPYSNHVGATETFILDATDDNDVIVTEQELGKDFWDDIENAQEAFQFRFNGLTPVASIPEALVNKWLREGFDVWTAPANEINRKLRIDGYDRFIISGEARFDH